MPHMPHMSASHIIACFACLADSHIVYTLFVWANDFKLVLSMHRLYCACPLAADIVPLKLNSSCHRNYNLNFMYKQLGLLCTYYEGVFNYAVLINRTFDRITGN